ncbi:hypothetical protein GJ496_006981 [Pomphorhynchus laevis]|nr:hypothetical protein GJ496_006981 [Pomphorhynchus laevis]
MKLDVTVRFIQPITREVSRTSKIFIKSTLKPLQTAFFLTPLTMMYRPTFSITGDGVSHFFINSTTGQVYLTDFIDSRYRTKKLFCRICDALFCERLRIDVSVADVHVDARIRQNSMILNITGLEPVNTVIYRFDNVDSRFKLFYVDKFAYNTFKLSTNTGILSLVSTIDGRRIPSVDMLVNVKSQHHSYNVFINVLITMASLYLNNTARSSLITPLNGSCITFSNINSTSIKSLHFTTDCRSFLPDNNDSNRRLYEFIPARKTNIKMLAQGCYKNYVVFSLISCNPLFYQPPLHVTNDCRLVVNGCVNAYQVAYAKFEHPTFAVIIIGFPAFPNNPENSSECMLYFKPCRKISVSKLFPSKCKELLPRLVPESSDTITRLCYQPNSKEHISSLVDDIHIPGWIIYAELCEEVAVHYISECGTNQCFFHDDHHFKLYFNGVLVLKKGYHDTIITKSLLVVDSHDGNSKILRIVIHFEEHLPQSLLNIHPCTFLSNFSDISGCTVEQVYPVTYSFSAIWKSRVEAISSMFGSSVCITSRHLKRSSVLPINDILYVTIRDGYANVTNELSVITSEELTLLIVDNEYQVDVLCDGYILIYNDRFYKRTFTLGFAIFNGSRQVDAFILIAVVDPYSLPYDNILFKWSATVVISESTYEIFQMRYVMKSTKNIEFILNDSILKMANSSNINDTLLLNCQYENLPNHGINAKVFVYHKLRNLTETFILRLFKKQQMPYCTNPANSIYVSNLPKEPVLSFPISESVNSLQLSSDFRFPLIVTGSGWLYILFPDDLWNLESKASVRTNPFIWSTMITSNVTRCPIYISINVANKMSNPIFVHSSPVVCYCKDTFLNDHSCIFEAVDPDGGFVTYKVEGEYAEMLNLNKWSGLITLKDSNICSLPKLLKFNVRAIGNSGRNAICKGLLLTEAYCNSTLTHSVCGIFDHNTTKVYLNGFVPVVTDFFQVNNDVLTYPTISNVTIIKAHDLNCKSHHMVNLVVKNCSNMNDILELNQTVFISEVDPIGIKVFDLNAQNIADIKFEQHDGDGIFRVHPNGTVELLQNLDKETLDYYRVSYSARLSQLVQNATLNIFVTDVNDNPIKLIRPLYPCELSSTPSIGSLICNLSWYNVDVDADNIQIFFSCQNKRCPFSINKSGEIIATSPIYENFSSTVTIFDGRFKDEITLDFIVHNSFDLICNPNTISVSVEENTETFNMLFDISEHIIGKFKHLNYSKWLYVRNLTFNIREDKLYLHTLLDFEHVREHKNIPICLFDHCCLLLNIFVIDINDNAPVFFTTNGSVEYFDIDCQIKRHPLEYMSAFDADFGVNSLIRYEKCIYSVEHTRFLLLHQYTGLVSFATNCDISYVHEHLCITAIDHGTPIRRSLNLYREYIFHIFNSSAVFTTSHVNLETFENATQNAVLFKIKPYIRNANVSSLKFEFDCSNHSHPFHFDNLTGVVRLRDFLNQKAGSIYNFKILTMNSSISVDLYIKDINNNCPKLASTIIKCDDHIGNGSLCKINATDLDFGENALLSYRIITTSVPFTINQNNGKLIPLLNTNIVPTTYDYGWMLIEVKDHGTPPCRTQSNLTIFYQKPVDLFCYKQFNYTIADMTNKTLQINLCTTRSLLKSENVTLSPHWMSNHFSINSQNLSQLILSLTNFNCSVIYPKCSINITAQSRFTLSRAVVFIDFAPRILTNRTWMVKKLQIKLDRKSALKRDITVIANNIVNFNLLYWYKRSLQVFLVLILTYGNTSTAHYVHIEFKISDGFDGIDSKPSHESSTNNKSTNFPFEIISTSKLHCLFVNESFAFVIPLYRVFWKSSISRLPKRTGRIEIEPRIDSKVREQLTEQSCSVKNKFIRDIFNGINFVSRSAIKFTLDDIASKSENFNCSFALRTMTLNAHILRLPSFQLQLRHGVLVIRTSRILPVFNVRVSDGWMSSTLSKQEFKITSLAMHVLENAINLLDSRDTCRPDHCTICNIQPCQHGGVCIPSNRRSRRCICPPHYFGADCQIKYNSEFALPTKTDRHHDVCNATIILLSIIIVVGVTFKVTLYVVYNSRNSYDYRNDCLLKDKEYQRQILIPNELVQCELNPSISVPD